MSLDIYFLILLTNIIIFKQAYSKNKVLNKLRKCQEEENEKRLTNIQNIFKNEKYVEDFTPMHDEVNMLNDENNEAEELG